MQKKIVSLVALAKKDCSKVECHQISIALMRIVLQHACLSLAEQLIVASNTSKHAGKIDVGQHADALRMPADGKLLSTLCELILTGENAGFSGLSKMMWGTCDERRACSRLSSTAKYNLEIILSRFVKLRNDGVEGHGIPGGYDKECDLDAVIFCAERLLRILPSIDTDGSSLKIMSLSGSQYTLRMLKAKKGNLICYRKIRKTSPGKSIVTAQVQTGLFDREEYTYEVDDIFEKTDHIHSERYVPVTTSSSNWLPYCIVPERITQDFVGRSKEMKELIEWFNDVDSRSCLIYGDGGIGKTTLALEFLHRILNGNLKTEWMPQIITYYTAKRTRWGIEGLEVIKSHDVGVADAATAIIKGFEGHALAREWYDKDVPALTQKVANYLSDWGIKRTQHLIVLDNTETMASSDDDVAALAKQIQDLARRVGRVLITSRRREKIEAHPIEIRPFDVADSVDFLRKRAAKLKRKAILQAGESSLRKYAHDLNNKPILLEAFLQAAESSEDGLKKSYEKVIRMQRKDLGDFLYADVWGRISERVQHLFLLMARVADIHDNILLKFCCSQVRVSVVQASEAFEESRGIASILRFNDSLQITFSPDFLRFCDGKKVTIEGVDHPLEREVELVRTRYKKVLASTSTQVHDRVSMAFRHVLARAAKVAFHNGDYEDCAFYYKQATIEDSGNGYLFDRYAYFLFFQRDYEEARENSLKSVKLLPKDPDVWFTRGMIEGRMGLLEYSLSSLQIAQDLGKPVHLCALQRAYAYINCKPPVLFKARNLIDEAEKKAPDDQYLQKLLAETKSLKHRIDLM